jgi:hypothetical protein
MKLRNRNAVKIRKSVQIEEQLPNFEDIGHLEKQKSYGKAVVF